MKRLFFTLVFLLLSCPAWGVVAVGGSSSGACLTHSGNVMSWTSHVIAGSDRLLIVAVMVDDAAVTVDAVTLGGAALTPIATINDGAYVKLELWKRVAPATGADTITVTTSAEPAYGWCAHEFNLTGVDQSTPNGAAVPETFAASTSNSMDVTGVAGGLVIDAIGLENYLDFTPDAGQTEINQASSITGGSVITSYKSGTGPLTMSWSWSTIDDGAQIGVPIYPVAATTRPPRTIIIQ